MTGWECHAVHISGVPRGYDQPSAIRILFDHLHQYGDLIDASTIGCWPVAPLVTIYRTEVAIGIRPFVPDLHTVIPEVLDIGITFQEPEQFMDDTFGMQFFRGKQRETIGKVEPHLVAETAHRASAGAVFLARTIF